MIWLIIAVLACAGAALGVVAIQLFGRSLVPTMPAEGNQVASRHAERRMGVPGRERQADA